MFGIIMDANVAPILDNIYAAILKKELHKKWGYNCTTRDPDVSRDKFWVYKIEVVQLFILHTKFILLNIGTGFTPLTS